MDEEHLLRACQLVDEGKFSEAYDEFIQLAQKTPNPLERAWPLIYAANTLQTLGQQEAAINQLREARTLIEEQRASRSASDEMFVAAEFFLDFEDANLIWLQGGNQEGALIRFDAALKKHPFGPKDPRSHSLYEAIHIRRAFILANLGRWREALPILEAIKSPREYGEGVAFYLGHCYSCAHDFEKAEEKLTEALKLGLPKHLECRAHCELGATYYNLQHYAKAKEEFEKGAQMADAPYIKESQIWRWLELTCRAIGLNAEAKQYAQMSRPS